MSSISKLSSSTFTTYMSGHELEADLEERESDVTLERELFIGKINYLITKLYKLHNLIN